MDPDPTPRVAESLTELCAHADFLQRLAQALLRDAGRAQDVVQDTLVAALEHPPRERAALRGWLARVVRNRALNAGRSEQRRIENERRAARPERVEGEEQTLEQLELQRFVSEAVLALSEPKRTVVYLRFYEGLAPAAIAERLGSPLKTVKSHLHRALEELRSRLDGRFGGERRAWALALVRLARRGEPTAVAIQTSRLLLTSVALLALALVGWWLTRASAGAPRSELPEPGVASASDVGRPPAALGSLAATPAATGRQAVAGGPPRGALEVRLRWASDGSPAALVGVAALAANDPTARPTRVRFTTDEHGTARFEALVAGPVELELDRGVRFSAEVVAGEERTLELVVPAGVDLHGRVVSSTGAPVRGASIWLENGRTTWPDPWTVASSGEDGAFRIRSLAQWVRIGARSPMHQASPAYNVHDLSAATTGEAELELVLPDGGQPVRGRVVDPTDRAVAEAVVWIGLPFRLGMSSAASPRSERSGPCVVVSDARGEFASADRFEEGVHDVTVLAAGFPDFRGTVEVTDEEPAWLEVVLETPVPLTGRVTTPAGEPVGGATVEAAAVFPERTGVGAGMHLVVVYSPPAPGEAEAARPGFPSPIEAFPLPPLRVTTDDEGRFQFAGLGAGPLDLCASTAVRPELGRARVRLAAGAARSCELVLARGRSLQGRVVDANERGLANWSVEAGSEERWHRDRRLAHTDEQGRFEFLDLEDCSYHVYATGPGSGTWRAHAEAHARPGAPALELVVADLVGPSASVHGVLLDSGGHVSDTRPLLYELGSRLTLGGERDERTGTFRIERVKPGRYVVQALRGGERLAAMGEPFELAEGQDLDAGTLVVEDSGGVELTVEGVAGNTLVGPTLSRPGFGSVSLAREGDRFRALDLAPGTWWLRVLANPYFVADRPVDVRGGETSSLALAAEPGIGIVLVTGADDELRDASDLWIEIRDAAGALLWRTEQLRAFSFRAWPAAYALTLPAGEVVIDARTSTGLRAHLATTIAPDPQTPLELELR